MAARGNGSAIVIRRIALDGETVVLEVAGRAEAAHCPGCGMLSRRVHDRYVRRPLDDPWRGFVVRWRLIVRRFCCDAPTCSRVTFAEPFGALLPPRQQRTAACSALLDEVAHALGGEAGARLAAQVGMPVSADTLLRRLQQRPAAVMPAVRVLGVDDFAFRRGNRYGTLLVDLETHQPIEVLAGREATVLRDWLQEHPGVEVVVRDRAEAYAEGARDGAPAAQQVADRFHLLQNATAALNEVLKGRRRQIEIADEREAAEPARVAERAGPAEPETVAPLSATKQRKAEQRARRVARWEEVHRRRSQGQGLQRIARDTGMDRRTIRHLLATADPPRNRLPTRPKPGGLTSPTLQPYVPYLQARWQAGCENVSQLYREIVAQGYPGSRSLLQQAVQPWRPLRPARRRRGEGARPKARRYSVRSLCLRPEARLSDAERQALMTFLAQEPAIAAGHALLERFRGLLADRNRAALDGWLAEARASALPAFVSLATGLDDDRAAVEAALTTPWSNGPVEGHVHRLKLIKRQGYGRASLALLRRRVLTA